MNSRHFVNVNINMLLKNLLNLNGMQKALKDGTEVEGRE
jgi:hypothetical protein